MPKLCLKVYFQKPYLASQYVKIYPADVGNSYATFIMIQMRHRF